MTIIDHEKKCLYEEVMLFVYRKYFTVLCGIFKNTFWDIIFSHFLKSTTLLVIPGINLVRISHQNQKDGKGFIEMDSNQT